MTTRRSFVLAGTSLAAGHALGATATDWDTATPQANGMREGVVANALEVGESLPGLRALLVAHRGVLVAERYYAGADAETLQPINSATKSVCSMLVGLALRDGRVKSIDDTVAQLLPEAIADVPDSPAGPSRCARFSPAGRGLRSIRCTSASSPERSHWCASRSADLLYPWRLLDGPIRRVGRADRTHTCTCTGCRLVRAGCSTVVRLDGSRALRVAPRP
jgi:hypothetical protein